MIKIGEEVLVFFIANNIHYNITKTLYFDRNIILSMSLINENFNVILVYRHHCCDVNNFFDELEKTLCEFPNSIIIGDFNINLLNQNDLLVDNYQTIVNSNGFNFLNNIDLEYATRIENRLGNISKTIIDHVITDLCKYTYNMVITSTFLSDHELIFLSINKAVTSQIQNFSKTIVNYQRLEDWNEINNLQNSNNFDELLANLKNLIIKCSETKNFIRKKFKSPWIDQQILCFMKKRDYFYKKLKKTPTK